MSAKYSLQDNKVALLQLDDGKANALSDAMIDALLDGIRRAESEAGALVVAGREDRFSAGFDLKVMMSGPHEARKLLEHGTELLLGLYAAKLPVVMAVTGHAMAGGALMALTGDQRIGAAGPYKIGLNEVQIGLPVPILAMELARDRLRATHLARATLEATIYDPAGAVEAGYLDEVVERDAVIPRALAEAARLATLPKEPYVASKARLRGKTIKYIRDTLADDLRDLLKLP
jgi:enoyl-CoA hydratase